MFRYLNVKLRKIKTSKFQTLTRQHPVILDDFQLRFICTLFYDN